MTGQYNNLCTLNNQVFFIVQVYTRSCPLMFNTCKGILWRIWLQIVGQLNEKQMHGRGFSSGLDHWVQCHRKIPVGCAQIKVRSCHLSIVSILSPCWVQSCASSTTPPGNLPKLKSFAPSPHVTNLRPKLRRPTKNSGISNGRMTASLMARLASSNPPMSSKRTCQVKRSWPNQTACEIRAVMLSK